MNKLLEKAIAEIATLPEDQQEEVAARLLDEIRRRAPRRGKWAGIAEGLDLGMVGWRHEQACRKGHRRGRLPV